MKILVEFEMEDDELDDFLSFLNEIDELNNWTLKKYPKKYKNIVKDYV